MNEQANRKTAVAVRLTESEKLQIDAQAATEGKATSAYIRDVLLAKPRRPLPNLAGAGSLLAICQALVHAAERQECPNHIGQFAREQAELVFEILRQHGHRGTIP